MLDDDNVTYKLIFLLGNLKLIDKINVFSIEEKRSRKGMYSTRCLVQVVNLVWKYGDNFIDADS